MARPCWLCLFLTCLTSAVYATEWRDATLILPNDSVALRDPRAISLGSDGTLYIADTGNHRLIAVNAEGKLIAEVGGNGGGDGEFRWPEDVKADRGPFVWAVDSGNRRVQRFSRLLEFQGSFVLPASSDETAPQPGALAVGMNGDMYVFDRDHGSIVRFDPLFALQSTYSGAQGFLRPVISLCFVAGLGPVWTDEAYGVWQSDPMLNRVSKLPVVSDHPIVSVSTLDSSLVLVRSWRVEAMNPIVNAPLWSLDSTAIRETGLTTVSAAAWGRAGFLYLLDSREGKVCRWIDSERE